MGFFDKLGSMADKSIAKKACRFVDKFTADMQDGTLEEGFDEALKQAHSYAGERVKLLIFDNAEAYSNHLGERGTFFAAVAYFYAAAMNEELGSGRWHSEYGVLDENKMGPKLALVVHSVLETAAINKEMTRSEASELLEKIRYTINHTAPGGWLTTDQQH